MVYPAPQMLRLTLMLTAESRARPPSDSKSASEGCQHWRSAEEEVVCSTAEDTSDSRSPVEDGTEEAARSWVDWVRLAFETSTAETLSAHQAPYP